MNCKIINLDSRPDRWAEVLTELPKLDITDFERFPAILGGALGCDKSHRECLKGEGEILILEDDVIFISEALNQFSICYSQLPEDWDMLYLGANVKSPAEKYSDNLYRIKGGTHTTHAILWSAKGRKRMQEIRQPGMCGTIDHWLYVEGQSLLECYICSPIIAFQRHSYSDIRLQSFDYMNEMLENAKNNMK